MRFDRALDVAAYFSQNMVPQRSDALLNTFVFCADNRTPVCGIIKTIGHEATRTVNSTGPKS